MFACLNPSDECYEENLATLTYICKIGSISTKNVQLSNPIQELADHLNKPKDKSDDPIE